MEKYASITGLAFLCFMIFTPCIGVAVSITEKSAVIGEGCVASEDNSTAMGLGTTASGKASTTMGLGTKADGDYSTALGLSTTANGRYSIAAGYFTNAEASLSTIIGKGVGAWAKLINNTPNSFMIGYMADEEDTIPDFFVKDGAVGIGSEDPRERLEVGGTGRAFFGDGAGDNRKGLLIDGIQGSNAARLEAYDYGPDTGLDLVINTIGNGKVGIGTSTPQEKLDIKAGNGRVEEGYNWLTNSDIRLKKNISTLDSSLDKISRVRGVRFDSTKEETSQKNAGKHIGVIAQELEKEYPELVVGDEETGYKAVAYDKLTAVLIEAVKELKDQNMKQKAEIQELRSLIKDLKS